MRREVNVLTKEEEEDEGEGEGPDQQSGNDIGNGLLHSVKTARDC
jgi:hypothetical protein